MSDHAFAGFQEDAMVADGKSKDPTQIWLVDTTQPGKLNGGYFAMDGYFTVYFVLVDCFETDRIDLLTSFGPSVQKIL